MFLRYVGLVALPLCCAAGHAARHHKLELHKGVCTTHCFHRGPAQAAVADERPRRGKVCNRKRSWRGTKNARAYIKAKARQMQQRVPGTALYLPAHRMTPSTAPHDALQYAA